MLICSGDDAATNIARGFIRSEVFSSVRYIMGNTGVQAPALIESILAPDCPGSAALSEADKTALKMLAKESKKLAEEEKARQSKQ